MAPPDERPCVFCAIATGQEPAARVLDEPDVAAFLDRRPLFPGHVLAVPRRHAETLPDLPGRLLTPLFEAVTRLSAAVPEAMDAEGSFVAVNNRVSQSVPHLHVHIVPRRRHDGLRGFFWPRHKYESDDEMHAVAERIRLAVGRRADR